MDPIAAYGAILATASIAWQIFTWWSKGAKLRGHANANMITVGGNYTDDRKYIGMVVSNVGDAPTTITHVVFMGFPSLLARLRMKATHSWIVTESHAQSAPHALPPGERFMSQVVQTPETEEWSRGLRLYMGVYHSMRRKPLLLRLPPIVANA